MTKWNFQSHLGRGLAGSVSVLGQESTRAHILFKDEKNRRFCRLWNRLKSFQKDFISFHNLCQTPDIKGSLKTIKIILTNKKHPFVKKRQKKNQTSAYHLKKRCLLVKGCSATMLFGILKFQNIYRLSDVKMHISHRSRTPFQQQELRFKVIGTCLILFVALFTKGCVFYLLK